MFIKLITGLCILYVFFISYQMEEIYKNKIIVYKENVLTLVYKSDNKYKLIEDISKLNNK